MFNFKYQLVITGNTNQYLGKITGLLQQRMKELGISSGMLQEITRSDFSSLYTARSPTVALYLGGSAQPDSSILKTLLADAKLILPIFQGQDQFRNQIPEDLHGINGVELHSEEGVEAIVNYILQGFGLLRKARRLFISYKRDESSGVAVQLFEALEAAGFDVFLDTHSIGKGDMFQDELWHRMVDTDVMVLLNTSRFLTSEWTKEELARANGMSIGIVQLIWPSQSAALAAQISVEVPIQESDFLESSTLLTARLHQAAVDSLVATVESLRARTLAARQNNLINEFIVSAIKLGKKVVVQPNKVLTCQSLCGKEILIIPAIGVPHAFSYNECEEMQEGIAACSIKGIYLLYDHLNIRKPWLTHLDWLDTHLPVNTIKITDRDNWIKSNVL